ncbi:MAG: peptidase M13 [Gammaproteobacteria bacterium]|nr:peptidase M13 [Gammaproteobacteria bacterium]
MVKKVLISALALASLAACGQKAEQQAEVEQPKELHSGIVLANMDTTVRPGDDFFSFVNGKWVAETEIPADKSSFSVFASLNDEAQENVKVIIEESANGDFAKGTDEQKVGDLYRSFMDTETRDARGVEPLLPELDRIDAISDYADLAVYFAETVKRNLDAPFGVGQVADFKNPKEYMIYAGQSGLGLPDREYYLKEDEKSEALRQQYIAHIEKMYGLAGLENGAAAAATVMALETRLAEQNMKKEDARNWTANYNKIALEDLPELMPNFNWDGYIAELGIADIGSLVVFTTDYMRALDQIIVDTDLATWKTYLQWTALNNTASRLTSELDQQNFAFYGTALSGTEEQRPMWRRATGVVNGSLGEVVGKVYVKRHFPPEAKERMLELVGNLVNAYEKSIKELDWMSEDTKVEALDKLSKFTPKIGYPDEWRDYSALDIEADDYFGNVERAALAEYQRQLGRQGGPVDRTEWGMTPQTVNAYYMPPLNEIVFPAAILQPPFFDLNADDAVNYGAIGAVIGHEIGHGFDDSGSTFDGDGVMRNWWTDEDRNEFEKRTGKLVEQYSAFAPFDDLSVNGDFTLGENIGDLGGISIGLLAYRMSLDGAEAPVIDGYTGVQRVFLGFAQVWRNKYRDESLRLLIGTDPHSPAMYRANGSVRNVPEFYEAFDVQEGDALYVAPEDRVKIW